MHVGVCLGTTRIRCEEGCAEAEGKSAEENGYHISGRFGMMLL